MSRCVHHLLKAASNNLGFEAHFGAMERKAVTLPTRAWSGSSMLAGIARMNNSAVIKMELPESESDLSPMVQAG